MRVVRCATTDLCRFLHAALLIEALLGCVSLKGLRDKLAHFPVKIEEMYGETFMRIEHQADEQVALAKKILVWVLYAASSLKLEDLQCALATSHENQDFDGDNVTPEDILLSVCCGLVTLDRNSRIVRLVREFTYTLYPCRSLTVWAIRLYGERNPTTTSTP